MHGRGELGGGGGGGEEAFSIGMEHWSSNLTPSFSQGDPDELSFKEGDLMVVLSKECDGWWNAEHSDGRKGHIPSNYVKAVSIT